MIFLKKLIGFVAVITVIPSVFAVTARPSVITSATSRIATMSTNINSTSSVTSGTITDAECIENYTDCIKGGEACGTGFEECTNKTLFFAKKPICASILMQCNTSGVKSLFGTGTLTYLANQNSAGEYVYPTDSSILGQLIGAGYINNRYNTSTCVSK